MKRGICDVYVCQLASVTLFTINYISKSLAVACLLGYCAAYIRTL